MTDEFPERELREFIYLNDESINSHLSSLGVGLETTQVASSEDETETSGRFAAIVPTPLPVAGSLSGKSTDVERSEKQIDITVPYRFQELIRQIKGKYEIKIPEEDDGDEIGYGDVIAVEGIVTPMSLFRFEIAQDATLTISHSAIAAEKRLEQYFDALEEHGLNDMLENIMEQQEEENDGEEDLPIPVKEAQADVTDAFVEISKGVTGDRVPIRIDSKDEFGGYSYGAVLDRNQLRVPETRAFFKPRRYTIFGRVEQIIPECGEWDPIDTTRVIQSFASDDVGISSLMDVIKNIAEDNQIEMKDEHITIDGKAIIIDPLAVYW